MAMEAQICWFSLLTYLTMVFFQAAFTNATITPKVPTVCHTNSNLQFFIRFSIPQKNGTSPVRTTVQYKIKDDTKWNFGKTYTNRSMTEIADWVFAPLQKATLYQVRIVSAWPVTNSGSPTDAGEYDDDCYFCSPTDKLEQVRNLSVHSIGPKWFALTWGMPPRTCPMEVQYNISYHENSLPTRKLEWTGEPGYPLTLTTGEQYVRITNGVQPNKTYFISFELSAGELHSEQSLLSDIKTPPGLEPLVLTRPPHISDVTNNSLTVSQNSLTSCTINHLCTVTWQYKELYEPVWRFAGKRAIEESIVITGLNASSMYEVRALIQRDSECEAYASDDVPVVEAATLPIQEPKIPEDHPLLVKATNTSLTMATDCKEECSKGYKALWQYKIDNDTSWKSIEEYALREITINDLTPDTNYEVRFNIYWPNGAKNLSEFSPIVEAKTCPNRAPEVRYTWIEERKHDSLTLQWPIDYEKCDMQYLVRWKEFDIKDFGKEFPPDSYDANKCPINATLLTEMRDCPDSEYYNCFKVSENITSGRRYIFEVSTMDAEGKCSTPEIKRTSSPYRYWGGISVGHWCLIILGMLLLFAAVPGCILLKKRVAARMAAGRDVAFSATSSNGSGPNGEGYEDVDGHVFQEPTTRILDIRS